jgi:hypothetical protein
MLVAAAIAHRDAFDDTSTVVTPSVVPSVVVASSLIDGGVGVGIGVGKNEPFESVGRGCKKNNIAIIVRQNNTTTYNVFTVGGSVVVVGAGGGGDGVLGVGVVARTADASQHNCHCKSYTFFLKKKPTLSRDNVLCH